MTTRFSPARLVFAIGAIVTAAFIGAYLYLQKQHEVERILAESPAPEERTQEELQRLQAALADQLQKLEEVKRQFAVEKLKLEAAEHERAGLQQEQNKIEADKTAKYKSSKRRQEEVPAVPSKQSRDSTTSTTAKVGITIRSTTCIEVEPGKYLIDMSGDANGPAGTYYFYAASNPNNGIPSMRTSCNSWSRTATEDGSGKLNMC